jgi:hypothetical protein
MTGIGTIQSALQGHCEPLTPLAIGVIDGGNRRCICEERERYFGNSHTLLLTPSTPLLPEALIFMSDDAASVEKLKV